MSGAAGMRVASSALVGRAAELRLILSAVSAPPAVVVVDGEAGIGKTRLVNELSVRPELADRRMLVGRCHRIREAFPLGPVIEAVRGHGEDLAGAMLSAVTGTLRPLLPEVAQLLPAAPEPLDDRAAERHRVFRGLVEVLDSLGPAVLVLEDLQWADQQTADFVGYLLSGPPPKLAMVLTFRGEEVDPGVRAVGTMLAASTSRTDVVLAPLDARDTGALAAAILGVELVSEEFAAYLRERTSGLPFAIEEVLALLRMRGTVVRHGGDWARQTLDELDVPTGIRDSVLERVSRLSDPARSVVEAAAVLQVPAPVSTVRLTSGLAAGSAIRALEEALDSGLLAEHGEAVGFRHLLAAQAVYEDVPVPRRSELHGRAAATLEALPAVPLGQVAHHQRHAGRLAEWAVAAERAAERAVELGNDAEVVRLLEDVLRHAPLTPPQRGRIAVKLCQAAIEALRAWGVAGLIDEVLAQDLPPAVRGELRFQLGLLLHEAGDDPVRERQLFADAVTELDDRPDLKAWAMVVLGIPMVAGVPVAEYRQWLQQALEVIPTVDDPVFEVFLLGKAAMVLTPMGDPLWRGLTDRIVERTGGAPRHRREVNAYWSVGAEASCAGDHETAHRLLTAGLQGALACESRRLELRLRSSLALLDYCRGSWSGLRARVEVLADELAGSPPARAEVEVVASCLALAYGDLDGARRRLTDVVDLVTELGGFDLLPIPAGALARLAVARGEADAATAILHPVLAGLESKGVWAAGARALPPLTEAMVVAAGIGEARTLVNRYAREVRDLDVPLAPAALRYARGVLEAAAGRWRIGGRHFLAAARLYQRLRCPYEAAQACEQAALSLFGVDEARADQALQAAVVSYRGLGAAWDEARVARIARQRGVSVPARHRGGRPGYGSELSPRERQVAELAATGQSNKEIAANLFLSVNTVSRHLTAAMRKLDVRSRAAITHRLAPRPPDGLQQN